MSTRQIAPTMQVNQAPAIAMATGAFLIPEPEFTVYMTLSGYQRTDGGPITTIYPRCCPDCRWPHLTQRYILSADPQALAAEYVALAKQGRLYHCPACRAFEIQPPSQSGGAHRCAYCHRIVELANLQGSAMSRAYQGYLRSLCAVEGAKP